MSMEAAVNDGGVGVGIVDELRLTEVDCFDQPQIGLENWELRGPAFHASQPIRLTPPSAMEEGHTRDDKKLSDSKHRGACLPAEARAGPAAPFRATSRKPSSVGLQAAAFAIMRVIEVIIDVSHLQDSGVSKSLT
jgi:hypothetical protein